MIRRIDAEQQTDRCFEYHAGLFAGVVGATAFFNRNALPAVAGTLGTGLALHAISLYVVASWRESIVRLTASLMEDRQRMFAKPNAEPQQRPRVAVSQT